MNRDVFQEQKAQNLAHLIELHDILQDTLVLADDIGGLPEPYRPSPPRTPRPLQMRHRREHSMFDPQREIKSFAISILRDPQYLRALEARLLAGECPDLDYMRYRHFHGPVPSALKWSPEHQAWGVARHNGGVEYFEPLHVLVAEAVRLYTDRKRAKQAAKRVA